MKAAGRKMQNRHRRRIDVIRLNAGGENQQRPLRLILRRRRHLARHRQMRQKSLQITRTQIFRMLLAMKKKLSFNPINIRLLSADAVMFHPQLVTHLIK